MDSIDIDILTTISVNSGTILALGGAFLIFRLQTKRDEITSHTQKIKDLEKKLEDLKSEGEAASEKRDKQKIVDLYKESKKLWLEECDRISLKKSFNSFLKKIVYLYGLLTLFGSTMLLSLFYFIFHSKFQTLFVYFIFLITTVWFFVYSYYEIDATKTASEYLEGKCDDYNKRRIEIKNKLSDILKDILSNANNIGNEAPKETVTQAVIAEKDLKDWIDFGWRFVGKLESDKVVVEGTHTETTRKKLSG